MLRRLSLAPTALSRTGLTRTALRTALSRTALSRASTLRLGRRSVVALLPLALVGTSFLTALSDDAPLAADQPLTLDVIPESPQYSPRPKTAPSTDTRTPDPNQRPGDLGGLSTIATPPAPPPAPPEPLTESSGVPSLNGISGIPRAALDAYRRAADRLAETDPSCNLDWQLLAAIGHVESHHGRYGSNVLTTNGQVVPGIYGPPLNGKGFALITDSDGGELDGDPVLDRAMGPMQFIPGTWRLVAADGNGDGVRDPQNIYDAAVAAATYLCAGAGDLSTIEGLERAIRRYNNSAAYVAYVLAVRQAYLEGRFAPVPNGIASLNAGPDPAAVAGCESALAARNLDPALHMEPCLAAYANGGAQEALAYANAQPDPAAKAHCDGALAARGLDPVAHLQPCLDAYANGGPGAADAYADEQVRLREAQAPPPEEPGTGEETPPPDGETPGEGEPPPGPGEPTTPIDPTEPPPDGAELYCTTALLLAGLPANEHHAPCVEAYRSGGGQSGADDYIREQQGEQPGEGDPTDPSTGPSTGLPPLDDLLG